MNRRNEYKVDIIAETVSKVFGVPSVTAISGHAQNEVDKFARMAFVWAVTECGADTMVGICRGLGITNVQGHYMVRRVKSLVGTGLYMPFHAVREKLKEREIWL